MQLPVTPEGGFTNLRFTQHYLTHWSDTFNHPFTQHPGTSPGPTMGGTLHLVLEAEGNRTKFCS